MVKISSWVVASCSSVALFLSPLVASAKSAGTLSDLVGARGSSGETAMQERGFVYVDGRKNNDASYTYWWRAAQKECVKVVTRDGRYESITDTSSSDCHHGDNTGAVIAGVAVVGVLGGLLLSHKSDHHKDNTHYGDQNNEAEYERGYRDGLYNQSYHNYSRTDAYSSGYEAGVDQRGQETSYRGNNHRGGYAATVPVNDLVNARAAGAETELQSRGFRNVDAFKGGNNSVTVWWNGQTRQCLQMITANGRANSLIDIGSHPKCR